MLFNQKINEMPLDHILLVVNTELLTLQMVLSNIESWADSHVKDMIHAETQKKWDEMMAWKVQILSAKKDVEQLQHLN
jgi:hypothetical protein